MPQLLVDNLEKSFPTRGEPLVVLRGASCTLQAGENLAVIGPSGSGKSTFLHIVGTLDRPTGGTVRLDGADPFALPEAKLAEFRNRRIGFVFQDHHLLPQCTVLENTLIPALALGPTKPAAVTRAKELLERVGLSSRIEHRPAELSGGERQRVAIARALVMQPTLLLADEPTGNLDRTTATTIMDLLLEMQRADNALMIVVTHSPELAARCQSRMEMDEGRLKPL
jgi:lipoprotein-releasing system ATP-binding protein